MQGMGDYYEGITAREERGMVICPDCETHYQPDQIFDECPACYERQHPDCACGCGDPARIVADVVLAAGIDSRSPWVDVEHARGAYEAGDPPHIDVIVTEEDFEKIAKAAPCWCSLREHSTVDWCPQCGAKE